MENQQEISDYLTLSLINGIGPRNARKIIAHYGTPGAFLEKPLQERIPGLKPERLSRISIDECRRQADLEIIFMEKEGVCPLALSDPRYPHRLKACDDGPLVLYTQGDMNLNANRMIAVVGTRKATDYGQRVTEEIIAELKRYNCTLVSGLAYGIDSMAHRAALAGGIQNVGVLAHGLDRLYPSANLSLSSKMKDHGGLVTDFPSGTNPDRENFPARNRIVAGLVDAVVVIEAAVTGGALITAGIALSYNRDVFAVPGRWGDPYSEGCNRLISNNGAASLSKATDLSWLMGWVEKPQNKQPRQTELFIDLSPDEELLLNRLKKGGQMELDNLSVAIQFPVSKTSALLLGLEFKGAVKTMPGKLYQALT
jgi:DNA processing protein